MGILSDKYGVRKITFIGMIFISMGSLIFALATGAVTAYLARLLIGIGSATFFVSTLRVIANWYPPESFTKLLGWTSLIGTSGALLAATPFSLLLNLIDWRNSFKIFALLSLFIAFLIWAFVRDNPAQLGIEVNFGSQQENRSFKEIILGMSTLVTSRQFWYYFMIAFIIMGSLMSLSGLWLVPYMTHVYELSRNAAANFVVLITLGMLLGSALLGWAENKIGDRIKMIRLTAIINLLIWSYVIFIFQARLPFSQLIIVLFLMGFIGMFILTSFANIKKMFPELKGSATGLINLSPFLGTIVFNFLLGWRLDATWEGEIIAGSRAYTLTGYRQGFIIIFIFSLVALFLSWQLERVED